MEEIRVENLVAMEKSEPKRRIVRSDGALYVLLLAGVIGIIVAGNALSYRWNLPQLYVQLTMYAVLLFSGWLIYKKCLIAFRYTLTERMLSVERVVGRKRRAEAHVHLQDIAWIRPLSDCGDAVHKPRGMYTGRRADALAVYLNPPTGQTTLLISPSEEFTEKLIRQWKTARK